MHYTKLLDLSEYDNIHC